MNVTRTAFGTWNGGRFMSYGESISEERWVGLVRKAHEMGVRTFLTADVYGNGAADRLLGQALEGIPRASYCLVALIGHDFYSARRDGAKGFPRFTDPRLRSVGEYESYLRMATERALERCRVDRFDLVMLHNPDSVGYSSERVWRGMEKLRDTGLTSELGVAPGPANGFTLDMILCWERFGALIDWSMIILNPFEPWPGSLVLRAAEMHEVQLLTRVVDFGGVFHDDVQVGHQFGPGDHRAFRPSGWIESAMIKLEPLRPIAERHGLTLLQLACVWCLQQPAVRSVVPTLIQEVPDTAKSIETKLQELGEVPEVELGGDELEIIASVGDNKGCMALKGGSERHSGEPLADQWGLSPDLLAVGRRWNIDPIRDLANSHSMNS